MQSRVFGFSRRKKVSMTTRVTGISLVRVVDSYLGDAIRRPPDSKGMLAQRTKVGWQVGRSLRLGKWRWANIALVDHYQCVIESWNDDFTPSLV